MTDWLYAQCLRAYPRPFRARFETGMRDAFREDLTRARARGTWTSGAFLLSTIGGTVRGGLAERLRRPSPAADGTASATNRRRIMTALTFDWRNAFRSLRATPVVTVVAVLSLALGIGANTALFSILNGLVLKTLPVREPARLALIDSEWTNPIWEQIRDRQPAVFDGAFAWSGERFDLADHGPTDLVDGAYASGGMFDVLGVHAALGRTFSAADDVRGGGPDGAIVVMSHAFWQRRFGGATDVVGRVLSVNRVPMTVVGVLPAGFFGPEVGRTEDLIVPLGDQPLVGGRSNSLDDRLDWWLRIMVRLKPGQTLAAASTTLNAVRPAIREATLPAAPKRQLDHYLSTPFELVSAATGQSPLRGRYQTPILIILIVVGAVLLIACANIATLLMARAAARRRELSLRMALGASRGRLARQLVAESLLLSSTGAALGLVLAYWASGLLVRMLATPTTTVSLDLSIDWRVLAFTAVTAIVVAMLFGIAPAASVTRLGPQDALQEQGRGVVGDRYGAARGVMVVLQVALSLGLVIVAVLFGQTFRSLTSTSLGFDSRSLLSVTVDASRSAVPAAGRLELFERLRVTAAATPGVTGASLSVITPVSGSGWNTLISQPLLAGLEERQRLSWVNFVTPEWFETYRMSLIAGRTFAKDDRVGAPDVVIANQAFVKKFFNGANPLGQSIEAELGQRPQRYEVVGVVNDAVYRSQRSGIAPTLYAPLAQSSAGSGVALTVRVAGGTPLAAARPLAEALGRVEPRAALTFTVIDDLVRSSVARERLVATLASFFGGLALLLAGLGLYGVTTYSVDQRRAEIGIRMALGCSATAVVNLVLRRLGWLMAAGVVLGASVTFWASRFVSTLLFGVTAQDPRAFALAVVVLTVIGGIAGWLPARRAARLDPLHALREG